MYTLAKELFPPTGIERVVRCNFVRPDVLNVIVSKSTVLEIYNFTEPAQADQLPRLELVGSYRMSGIITSMGAIRTSSSGQHGLDSILVSFKDAKVRSLPTVGLHMSYGTCTNKAPVFTSNHTILLCRYRLPPPFHRCPCWNGHSRITALSLSRSTTMSATTTRYLWRWRRAGSWDYF
jgi:hypothetical protein